MYSARGSARSGGGRRDDDDAQGVGTESTSIAGSVYNPRKALPMAKQRALLPIAAKRGAILRALEERRCLVVVGSTGSGKTTQIPQYLMEAGWCEGGRAVVVTEPRRVAAVAAAERVATEKGQEVGGEVGVAVRFEHRMGPDTSIVFSTEGTLLRTMMGDPLLSRYSVVLVDEAHERSVACDVLLGLLKKVQRRRGDLRLVVASATMRADEFVSFFGDDETAVVGVEGKSYPVEVSYLGTPCGDYLEEALRTVVTIHRRYDLNSGAILVFLSRSDECEELAGLVAERLGREVVAEPLYAALPTEAQVAVLEPAPRGRRKVIAATNVAETSLTIGGVAYVVDTMYVNVKSYSVEDNVSTLAQVPVSQASAKQRAGRAGRTRPGQCFRLCTAGDFARLALNTPPEVQRADLTWLVLQLKSFGVDDLMSFDFPTAPPVENVAQALDRLYYLGAVDDDGNLTARIGLGMVELPLEPELARAFLAAEELGCAEDVAAIAGMLQSASLLITASPQRERRRYEAIREPYRTAEGDLLTYLNMFNAYRANGSSSSWCSRKGFNPRGFKQARRVAGNLLKFVGNRDVRRPDNKERLEVCIQKSICAGFFQQAAFVAADGTYRALVGGPRRTAMALRVHPTSVLFDRYPKCVVFTESVQTTSNYMRHVTVVEPRWLVELAPKLYEDRRKRALADLEQGLEQAQSR